MNLLRISLAAALAAALAVTASGQAPPPKDPPKDPPAATPPAATPPSTPAAPKANPAIAQAVEELNKNNFEKAVEIINKARETDKLLEPALVIISRLLYSSAGNNAQTMQVAKQLLEQAGIDDPNHPDPYILSGQYALNEGRYLDAMLDFEAALAKAGDARFLTDQRNRFIKSAREGLARAYSQRKEVVKAFDQLTALLSEDPKNAVIRSQVAQLKFVLGQPDAAYEELKHAFADDKNNPQVGLPEVNMAGFWDRKPFPKDKGEEEAKNKATAEDWYKKALAAYPKDVRAPREYGRWLLNQSRIADADKQLADAKAIDGADSETKALVGLSFRYKKQFNEAEAIFNELNSADRLNVFYAWNLALSMAESSDEKKRLQGLTIAQLAQSTQPKNPEAYSVLAWCLFKLDRIDDADTAINSALKAGNNAAPPDTVYYWSRILEKRGKGEEARDKIKQAVESKGPFVYRKDAEALYDELVKKHGPVKAAEPKKDAPKPESPKPPETPKP